MKVLLLPCAAILLLFFPAPTSARYCGPYETLVCNLTPTKGSIVTGRILFRQIQLPHTYWWERQRCVVRISGKITGLATRGMRQGWHIHTYGDTLLPTGTTTGGHFTSPNNRVRFRTHGFPKDTLRHWGDLGNLWVNSRGIARPNQVDQVISLGGIVGRAIIVHANEDVGSQPSGGAGARVAQGVIGIANPDAK